MAAKKKKTQARKTGKKPKNKPQWPVNRDVLFRPNRHDYVRKVNRPDGCVFCFSAKEELSFDTLCIYKTKHSQILLNKYPYNSGHLLVLPTDHVGSILDLSPERYDDLHHTLRLAVQAIQDVYAPTGMNLGLNQGSSAGAGIPDHMHYHLVPRWNGDLNFFPLIAGTKAVIETLECSYQKFSDYFKKVQA